MSRPSTSSALPNGNGNGKKRTKRELDAENPAHFNAIPLADSNGWFYPSHGFDTDDTGKQTERGNWGNKDKPDARWTRRGKAVSWGPGVDDMRAEDRARKRIKLMLEDTHPRSPSPPTLPHLADPPPPITAPYPQPLSSNTSYTAFVMDKSITRTFRSPLLDELERGTSNLIEGESTLRRALGRLWQVINDRKDGDGDVVVPKREEGDDSEELDDREKRIARAPDLTPPIHKLFLYSGGGEHFGSNASQHGNLDKAVVALRELQEDTREYTERLLEIREGLGEVRAHRNGVWEMVRLRAIDELQESAATI